MAYESILTGRITPIYQGFAGPKLNEDTLPLPEEKKAASDQHLKRNPTLDRRRAVKTSFSLI